jgi:hypothetical protein
MKNYLIKKIINIIIEILVEFLIATFLGVPFDLTRILKLFTLCEIINYDFELPLQCLIQNRLLYTLIINVISNTAAILILDGNISDPVNTFTVMVIGIVIKYVLQKELNERVDNYSLL